MSVSALEVTQPGVYDLPAEVYHADPVPYGSLSSTDARRLLESPAKFRWHRDHDVREASAEFDFGHAAHELVLGRGGGVVVCEFDDWRTKDARAMRDEARANGQAPVLAKDFATVEAMADQLRLHPIAVRLLQPERGQPEQALFWIDGDVWRRALLDWLPEPPKSGRLIVADYKTTADASPRAFARSVANFGYHQQAAWYLDGIHAVCGVSQAAFVFIAQEKSPPYLVNVVELDGPTLLVGQQRNRRAIELFRECRDSGVWPGYGDDVGVVGLPRWAEVEHEEDYGVPSW
jgi:hypothetical protein